MSADKTEVVEGTEIETAEEHHLAENPQEQMSGDAMDNMIQVAEKMGAYDKALTTIMNIVMKRTYAGDWVSHSREKDAPHLRQASLSGAGCERVAVILGINERGWKEHEKMILDEGKAYGFRYEADFTLGKRTVHAYGEASTKNKFFGYENGKWKEITDIREDHVRKAAYRECFKDGIRRLLGLRKIPLMKLKELGFNLDLVHYVNFKDAGEATGGQNNATPKPAGQQQAAAPAAAPAPKKEKEVFESWFTPMAFEHLKTQKGTGYTKFTDQHGGFFSKWGEPDNEKIQMILAALRNGDKQVRVSHHTEEKDGRVYRNIVDVLEVGTL